eukprot:5290997-Prorocentrum_lima.AAC.1
MTSSLVGSEMCIRDSPSNTRAATPRPTGSLAICPRHDSRQHRACSAGAVSYTHLTLPTICSV